MSQELIVTVGLPASGKTTWTNEFIENTPSYVNVNRDDIRLALQGRKRYNKFSKWRENIVSQAAINMATCALKEGKSVIISDTNLNPGRNENWKVIAKEFNATYREKLFTDIHYGVCLERDMKREFPVGQRVITGMFEKGRGVWFPKKPVYDSALPDAIIVDVDGTIATMHGRGPYEWDKVDTDLPKTDVIAIVAQMKKSGSTVIIASGRDGSCKEKTIQWFKTHSVDYDEFYIRPAGDSRKDTLIKEEIYINHIKGRFNIVGVFDDRNQVCHLYRHLGLTVFQVDYGAF